MTMDGGASDKETTNGMGVCNAAAIRLVVGAAV